MLASVCMSDYNNIVDCCYSSLNKLHLSNTVRLHNIPLSDPVCYCLPLHFRARVLSERSALQSITFLLLVVHKYKLGRCQLHFFSAAPTSIHIYMGVCRFILSVVHILYARFKQCTGWEFGILGLISLEVMSVPAPFAVGYICITSPR